LTPKLKMKETSVPAPDKGDWGLFGEVNVLAREIRRERLRVFGELFHRGVEI